MTSVPWLWIVLASVVLPPLGFLLLWVRSGTRLWKKLLLTPLVVAFGVTHLALFFGLRVQMLGGGVPSLYFYKPEAHYKALEESRARHATPTPAPAGAASEPAPPSSTPAAATAPVAPAAAPAYWTSFRGPRRDGVYDEAPINTAWPAEGLPLLWKQPVGGGYASFVIAEGRAFTIEQRRDKEVVAAYDLDTGRELWTNAWATLFQETMGGDGPRATPAFDDGRLYALGAAGELRCLEARTGQQIWRRNILEDNQATNLMWGMAASPLVVDDAVIVQPGGPANRSVVAYHKLNGELLWGSLSDKQAYTSPALVTLAGKRQILTATAERIVGLNVGDGALLWEYPWKTEYDINAAQPVVLDGSRLVFSSGYGRGAVLVEITATEKGLSARRVWENTQIKTRFNAAVLHEGHLYGLDEGILVCVEAATGTRKWKGGRYGYGQTLLASGHLVISTEDGDLALVKATPEKHTEVARFTAIPGKTWNHPAIAGGRLLVRNTTEMAAYRIGK